MDTGTDKNNLDWLNPDALVEFIDELRESGYKIGISQYIAAHDLILMLIAQGETLDNPERLRNLLGPIFCSSPTEQEEFRERFDHWVELYNRLNLSKEEIAVEAEALSDELETINSASYRGDRLIFLILVSIFLILVSIFLFFIFNILSSLENSSFREPRPTGETTAPVSPIGETKTPVSPIGETKTPVLPPVPTGQVPEVPARGKIALTELPITLSLDWRILLLYLVISVAFFLWRPWWRANRFLQRNSTTQQPELYKISITGFEDKLVSKIVLLKVAQSLKYRIRLPSRELDVNKTINATLSRGGWLTPVYRTYQILPEYLFLVNRASYRDHQAKFMEEMIERLKDEGVFISIYFFDDDPRMCFPHDREDFPLRLREVTSKYSQHSLVIISNTESFFSPISGELEPWVNQLTSWDNRAVLTPTPAENWGHQELKIAQQFIILPATIKGLQVLSQRLRQGVATYSLAEETRIPLPDSLRIEPYLWIERNPPASQQINIMLESLERYLGKDSFYWLSACAVFPELHWNITIYLGNILKSESGKSLIEVCSLTDLARLPWLRYGYIPDWLRIYLITTLTKEQQQIIRTALQDLLNTAIQGSVSKLQLEIARQADNPLLELTNSIRSLLFKQVSKDILLRDYIFLGFMTRQSVLTMKVSDEFSRSLRRQKKHYWWLKVLRNLGIVAQPPIHQPNFVESNNSTPFTISRRKFLTLLGWGVVGLFASVIPYLITQFSKRNSDDSPNPEPILKDFNFEIVVVNAQGNIADRANRTAQSFMESLGNGVNLEMVAIPGGSFLMGSPEGEEGRHDDESPQHLVNVSGFFMGKYQITQAQYQAIMGNNPARFKGDTRPVETVSWNNAVEFCKRLSEMTGRTYRLPSEAEWEYSCRAGTTTPFYFGATITADLVNYYATSNYASAPKGEFRLQTTPVSSFPPNAFGLYNMHGNVWEWCQDTWHGNYNGAPTDGSSWIGNDNRFRLLRGGSWYVGPSYCRSACRSWEEPDPWNVGFGFRVVVSAART